MNVMKEIQRINEKELQRGLTKGSSSASSWHDEFKSSAYIFVSGLPLDLTEGDVLCIFAQYGEIVDINLVRDKASNKSRGFCFIAYEDQRSTVLAVDNFNGTKVLGRTLRVDHVKNYRLPKDLESAEALLPGQTPLEALKQKASNNNNNNNNNNNQEISSSTSTNTNSSSSGNSDDGRRRGSSATTEKSDDHLKMSLADRDSNFENDDRDQERDHKHKRHKEHKEHKGHKEHKHKEHKEHKEHRHKEHKEHKHKEHKHHYSSDKDSRNNKHNDTNSTNSTSSSTSSTSSSSSSSSSSNNNPSDLKRSIFASAAAVAQFGSLRR